MWYREATPTRCTCDIKLLFSQGCVCGGAAVEIQKEQELRTTEPALPEITNPGNIPEDTPSITQSVDDVKLISPGKLRVNTLTHSIGRVVYLRTSLKYLGIGYYKELGGLTIGDTLWPWEEIVVPAKREEVALLGREEWDKLPVAPHRLDKQK